MIKFLSKTNLKKYAGKTALLRIDLNIEPGGELDSYRLEAVIPTIKLLLKNKTKIILLSHRGRPGKYEKNYSLAPFGPIFAKKLKTAVDFVYAARTGALEKVVKNSDAKIVLVENLRFFQGEEANDPSFTRELAKLGDFFVNDAFAVSHRKNASVVAITKYLPSYGGLLLEKELKKLGAIINYSAKPFVIVLGGAKVSDKVGVLKYFWNKADKFIIAGGPANTFFLANGLPIGKSFYDKASLPFVKKFIGSPKIVLPSDIKVSAKKILDIGPQTINEWSKIIAKSKTIIWNGPIGLFEKKGFEKGTIATWKAIFANKKAIAVIGGGETLASLKLITNNSKLITKNKNLFLSTGGGAMLEFLSGKKLLGIEALR
ncbi:MAG: phosphoglycerate kinase [Patescibacteria group bacterium]